MWGLNLTNLSRLYNDTWQTVFCAVASVPWSCSVYLFCSCMGRGKHVQWTAVLNTLLSPLFNPYVLVTGPESLIFSLQIAKNEGKRFQCESTRYLVTGWFYFCLQSFLSFPQGNSITAKQWRGYSLLFGCLKVNFSGGRFHSGAKASSRWPCGHSWTLNIETWEYYKRKQDKSLQFNPNKAANSGSSRFGYDIV